MSSSVSRLSTPLTVATCRTNIKNLKCMICGKEIEYFDVFIRYHNTRFIAHLKCAFENGYVLDKKHLIYMLKKLKIYLEAIQDLKQYINDVVKGSKGNLITVFSKKVIRYFRKTSGSYAIILNLVLRTLTTIVKVEKESKPRTKTNTVRRTMYRFPISKVPELINVLTQFEQKIQQQIQYIQQKLKE